LERLSARGWLPSFRPKKRTATAEYFRTLIENATDHIVVVDVAGTVLYQSPSVLRANGMTLEEAVGRTAAEELHKDDAQAMLQTLAEVSRKPGGSQSITFRSRRKDGSWFPVEGICTNLLHDPVVNGIVINARDMTERHRMEQELRQAREEALEASRLKSEFLASMGHEIRTPSAGVLGMARLLPDSGLTRQQREYDDSVRSSAESLLSLLNDVLDFSRIEAGKCSVQAEPFDLRAAVQDVADLLSAKAAEKQLELVVRIAPGAACHLVGDVGRIRQVLNNLVGNAIKFTHQGQVVIQVTSEEAGGGEADVALIVEDTGIGIPANRLDKIFESFVQGDGSDTRHYGGTGLGLAISRRLAMLMGGSLTATSRPGQGSAFRFHLRLPLAQPPRPASGAATDLTALDSAVSAKPARRRVLVVEDNHINQRVARHMLQRLGCYVDVAANGREGVQMLKMFPYDLVFMDCQMPELNGYEAAAEIRRMEGTSRHTPIVAMTAHAMQGDRERCLAAGMDDYISKPVRQENYVAALERWARAQAGPV